METYDETIERNKLELKELTQAFHAKRKAAMFDKMGEYGLRNDTLASLPLNIRRMDEETISYEIDSLYSAKKVDGW